VLEPPVPLIATLAPLSTAVRLSLHVLAAAIWVGGQFTVAGLLGTVRKLGEGAPKMVARAFGRVQWPAYVVLVGTGIWNVVAEHPGKQTSAWNAVLYAKIAVVFAAGLAAYLHQRSRSRAGLATYGAVSGLASLAALVLGVLLAG
jgi:putative copper export protein